MMVFLEYIWFSWGNLVEKVNAKEVELTVIILRIAKNNS